MSDKDARVSRHGIIFNKFYGDRVQVPAEDRDNKSREAPKLSDSNSHPKM